MFILHTDTDDLGNPLRGGQPVRTYEINSRLAERHDITVLTSVYKGCRRRETRGHLQYRRLGFRLPPLGLSPHLSFLACLGPAVRAMRHDLIIEEFTPPVGFCMLPWWTGRPVISMVQWFFFDAWEKRYHLPFERWMRAAARKRRYGYFIVMTQSMARTFRDLVPDAVIKVIPEGISSEACLPQRHPGDYVLYLGRIDILHKGLDMLLDAWTQHCAGHAVPLVIVGEGQDRKKLEDRVAGLGLSALVSFTGRAEGPAKAELLSGARLVAVPSRFETFGIVALEAMAAGKPVVAFDIDNLNEVVRPDWGCLVKPFDAAAFAQAVCGLWQNPERCRELGLRARQTAEAYTWDKLALEQEAFYCEVIKRAARDSGATHTGCIP